MEAAEQIAEAREQDFGAQRERASKQDSNFDFAEALFQSANFLLPNLF